MTILNASLDTSFWTYASQTGVTPYLFSYFRVHYCQAVRSEIITINPENPSLVYPQAMLFQVFEEDGRLHQVEPANPLPVYGAGEAHAIALAREHNWVLLINDSRPLEYARLLGVATISVPGFCAFLYAEDKISLAAVNGYLKRLGSTTSASLIAEAIQTVAVIAKKRGDEPNAIDDH
jgi:predicted nucleic acid-binding protein